MDAYGRYTPAPNRFVSSVPDKGFKPWETIYIRLT